MFAAHWGIGDKDNRERNTVKTDARLAPSIRSCFLPRMRMSIWYILRSGAPFYRDALTDLYGLAMKRILFLRLLTYGITIATDMPASCFASSFTVCIHQANSALAMIVASDPTYRSPTARTRTDNGTSWLDCALHCGLLNRHVRIMSLHY